MAKAENGISNFCEKEGNLKSLNFKGNRIMYFWGIWPRKKYSLQYQYFTKQASNENWVKFQVGDYKLIQYWILQTKIIGIVCQTEMRIINEILGLKWLTPPNTLSSLPKVHYRYIPTLWPVLLEVSNTLAFISIKKSRFQLWYWWIQ